MTIVNEQDSKGIRFSREQGRAGLRQRPDPEREAFRAKAGLAQPTEIHADDIKAIGRIVERRL